MMTAVEWFELELKDKLGEIVINQNWKLLENIIKQAVEMERKQIIDARENGIDTVITQRLTSSEQYYNETYNSERIESIKSE
jgi:adenylate kinase